MADGYQHRPQGVQGIVAKMRELEKGQRDLRRMITGLGLSIDPDGNLTFGAAGKDLIVKGGSNVDIEDDGTLHVTGDTIIDGTLSLPNASVNNAALVSPLSANYYFALGKNYALGTNPALDGSAPVRASFTITMPTGFTSMLIFASVQDYAWNDTANSDYLLSVINFGTANQDWVRASSATVPPSSGGQSIVVTTDQYTGMSGGDTLSVQSRPFVDTSEWSQNASNSTVLSALAIFFR